MEKTVENSKKLWTYAKEPLMNLEKLNKKSSDLAVRDQINLTFCKQLFDFQEKKLNILQAGEELPPDMDQDVPQVLVDMEKNEYKRMFSPYLELKGFDTIKDTPVEILHVFLLGPVKYLFGDFMKGLDGDQKKELLALWNSFNTNSLNIPSIRATSMVQYSSSLIEILLNGLIKPNSICYFTSQNLSCALVQPVFLPQKNLKAIMVSLEMLQFTPTAKVLVKI
ncbi:uncharacterized protein PGTG_19239 [Puccinia graminis f. sp. tritici CRL 75-36-700-3]|uniref:Uncharacterized protein n=1 Tax=Puccinia graminis f. sp. tritici (strain CRL 75-36-700-3 / race SCCL) TaxID=418459 RepID=E3LA77_PUCGT|nr:uncharacterized protein PGTG_19239 [Puccinia graminis f. sp. tritici CRL 75-36-700-3]EFP93436.2 hypothetical protein PGTG_19239 [Puccinia graminis f. sp. tritici CRL 75-36-700-3]